MLYISISYNLSLEIINFHKEVKKNNKNTGIFGYVNMNKIQISTHLNGKLYICRVCVL